MAALSGIVVGRGAAAGAVRFDEFSSTVLYYGESFAGASDADPVWQIQRITFITPGSDDLIVEFADSNNAYDNVWNDRTTLTYG
ncbi:hypothetical protein [[Eubacterium] cellulosolvens]